MAEETVERHVIYETYYHVLFSPMAPTKNGFGLQWKPWKPRHLEIYNDATLFYKKEKHSPIKDAKFNLSKVVITLMDEDADNQLPPSDTEAGINHEHTILDIEKGMTVKCTTLEGIDTYFRVIFKVDELQRFTSAIQQVSHDVKYSKTKRLSQSPHTPAKGSPRNASFTGAVLPPVVVTIPQSQKKTPLSFLRRRRKSTSQAAPTSIMRSTIASAMDNFDQRSVRDRIVGRRGEMKWLPVFFQNDLVHGSWWFVVGSIAFVISALIMLLNSYHTHAASLDLGSDDSVLTPGQFRATWVLMVLSGIFSTLGSLGFVRAMYQDPPMKPLFYQYYHLQNDELLGSWLFLVACIPLIPYCLIYLSSEGYNSLIYLGALVISILLCLGTYLFVRACYPNDRKQVKILKPMSRVLCWCCCKRAWLKRHLANDWLAGTWFILWASLFATVSCFILFIGALAEVKSLQIFLMGTTFFENFCFMVGSAYFVAGSYPETSLENDYDRDEDDEDADDSPDSVENDERNGDADGMDGDEEGEYDVEEGGGSVKSENSGSDPRTLLSPSNSSSSSSSSSSAAKTNSGPAYSHRSNKKHTKAAQSPYHNIDAAQTLVHTPSHKPTRPNLTAVTSNTSDTTGPDSPSIRNPMVFTD